MDDTKAAREAKKEAKRKKDAVVIENLLAGKKAKRVSKQAFKPFEAAVVARLDHEASLRAAERAAADARTAAHKAMLQLEKKKQKAAEANIEFERKDKAWDLAVKKSSCCTSEYC